MMARPLSKSRLGRAWWLVFGTGLCVSLVMALRSRVGPDQRLMLDLGWRLVARAEWVPHGMPTSAGGYSPGGLQPLVVALPLYVWRDYRAPALLTALLHAAAFLLFVRTVRPALSANTGPWLLLVLVWLNPWRAYFSAHLWNPNFMPAIAILHLVTAQRMRSEPHAVAAFFHALAIGLGVQLHTSAATLAILSALLYLRRSIRIHWGGVAAAAAVVVAMLVPWARAVLHEPTLLPGLGGRGFPFRGLLFVFPWLRGAMYWVKLPTLAVASRMVDFDFRPLWGESAHAVLAPVGAAAAVLAQLTVVPSAWANWRFVRKNLRCARWRQADSARARAWLQSYVATAMLATGISFAVTPTTTMFWQTFVDLPAAALVLVMAVEGLARTGYRRRVAPVGVAWCALLALLLAFQTVAAPAYRCGAWDPGPPDAMLRELRVATGCR